MIRCLQEHGEQVVSFGRSADPEVLSLFSSEVKVIIGDIGDPQQVAAIFKDHPDIDHIVHAAYMMGVESEAEPPAAMRVNALGPATLFAEACAHRVERVVFVSSESIYGKSQAIYGDRPVAEEDYCSPSDHVFNYSLTKLLNEHLAAKYEARYGVPIVSVRAPVVFGHGRKHGTTVWASDFASLPARGQPVKLPFPENDSNCYIYVADLAEQIYQLSTKPSLGFRIYNSGGYTLLASELATLVREVIPEARIAFTSDGSYSLFINQMDDRRIREELGYQLRSMPAAIKEHIEEVWRTERLHYPAAE